MNHSPPLRLRGLRAAATAVVLAGGVIAAHANDFPTAERVLYVEDCIRANPGPYFEMVNKCSCAVDAIAAKVKYAEYTTMQTISNGMTIGGERGGAIRDVPTLQPELKKYRALQAQAKQSCFIADPK